VAVVGAGIIGATLAWRLAQQGLQVDVYDAGTFAGESSAAGAGMLAPGGEAHELASWARDTVIARAMYPAFVRELREASGQAIDFRECGAVDLALDEADWIGLQRRREVQQQLGIAVQELSRAECRRMTPALSPQAAASAFPALWFPDDATVSPREITAALALLLPRLGVRIHEHCAIGACTWRGTHFELRGKAGATSSGPAGGRPRLAADAVVIAAGAWSSSIAVEAEAGTPTTAPRPAEPIRGHLIQCTRRPGTLGPIVRHQHLYVFQRQNGAVISGSNEEHVGFQRTPNLQAVQAIHQHTEALLPGLFPPLSDSYWLGFRPGIAGSGPEVRRLGELPLWLAYGHYRNGILLAPHTAARLCREISDGPPHDGDAA
jgi:glycine oxidase